MKITLIYTAYFEKLADEQLDMIEATAPDASISEVNGSEMQVEDIVDSDIIFGRIPPRMLPQLKKLKWNHMPTAGADGMTDKSLYASESIVVTKASGTYGIPIAEHIVGMILALSHTFGYYFEKQGKGLWCDKIPTNLVDIYGSTVLVLGLGDIGTEVCRCLSGFGCNIIGFRQNASKPHDLVSDVRSISQLKETLPSADYIIICTPGTEKTTKLFGSEEFNLMKKRAIIINIGRGKIIDTNALNEALVTRKIGGAGLDVTDPEPLPKDHPLWKAPNVLITPHVSGITQTATDRRVTVFLDLLKRYVDGRELYNVVDLDEGY